MKKTDPKKRPPAMRRTGSARSVEAYLARVPEPARSTLEKLRATVRAVAPAETTEVISYGIPAFRLDTPTHKGMLIWYAAFSGHCSLFPTASVIDAFRKELEPYRLSKGTIQFPIEKPLPAALVRKLVKARLSEVENKERE